MDWRLLYFVVTEIAWQPNISVEQYKRSNLTALSSESRVVGYFLVTDSLSQNIQYNDHHFIFVFALQYRNFIEIFTGHMRLILISLYN